MSQIHLYFDEDALQSALVSALKNSKVDVVTVADAARFSFSDEEQLIWAKEQSRVVYSFNMGDFQNLHHVFIAKGIEHSGIILAPQQRYSIGEQLRGLLKLISQKSAEDMVNQLIFLSAYIKV
ncbi:DUF5615 family PIN-like protein [Pseudanabaena sp. BC1403]|uniref:DUF5615 family PIN-like protein n=1 Tax=Pseudanabaena sp. BC1403 TaxID=2043171 RepID=UPI000CD878D1|nr:DUF5615 family PIN-like protein [Pseudanabaena sp. BC1403]